MKNQSVLSEKKTEDRSAGNFSSGIPENKMKPDYKNWVPCGMITTLFGGSGLCTAIFLLVVSLPVFSVNTALKITVSSLPLAGAVILFVLGFWMVALHRAFSYGGKRQMARQIVDGIADHIHLPEGGIGLDVGCGSGALTIACAKRNPLARIIGIDTWGRVYPSFNKERCEHNAKTEGVANTEFRRGDARKLDFPDETFDVVMSNYVYHNIMGADRQELLLETLRTLKKGGVFVIHDLMSSSRYGDIRRFADKLLAMGYQEVNVTKTADGLFMTVWEGKILGLSSSRLLTGIK